MKNSQQERQSKILTILSRYNVTNQSQLQQILNDCGYLCNQSTLSRDLKKLNVVKTNEKDGSYKLVVGKNISHEKKVDGFVAIEFSGNFPVIKTLPAFAPTIASLIDNAFLKEIISTISGDDTVLVIPRDGFNRRTIREALKRVLPDID